MTGTGLATALRASRKLALAAHYDECSQYLGDVSLELIADARAGKKILIEGHQGYGLSNYHGDYPYTSSRDCTTAALLSELGLPPSFLPKKLRVVVAAKIFPTRNHAGHLFDEVSVDDATALGIEEFGGGSWGIPNRRRRVGIFDPELVRRACLVNGATELALTGADYLDREIRGRHDMADSRALSEFLTQLKAIRDIPGVKYISTGPDTGDMIVLTNKRLNAHSDLFARHQ